MNFLIAGKLQSNKMLLSFSLGSDGSSFNSSVADQQVGLTFLSHPLEDMAVLLILH